MYVCGNSFQDDCFDSSWMLHFTLTYSHRLIQRGLLSGAIPMKFPQKPVKERHFSKQRKETNRK